MMDSCIYVVTNSDAVKIGVSKEPEKRLKQLQTGSVDGLALVYCTPPCSNAYEIEAAVHAELSAYRFDGSEWFAVGAQKAVNAVVDIFDACAFISCANANDAIPYEAVETVLATVEKSLNMVNINSVFKQLNEMRVENGLPKKQLASFFQTEVVKSFILMELRNGNSLSEVKRSKRGKGGGTLVSERLFAKIVEWMTGYVK